MEMRKNDLEGDVSGSFHGYFYRDLKYKKCFTDLPSATHTNQVSRCYLEVGHPFLSNVILMKMKFHQKKMF